MYYIRQLDEADGVTDFDGIVWFGQQFEREPIFANVFIGRLRLGVRRDARGHRVDAWEGRFFDVPKGTVCGAGALNLESLTIDASDIAGGCDFPEHYLRKKSGSGFGGSTWPLPMSFCWDSAFRFGRVVAPPAIPPRIAAARAASLEFRHPFEREVAELGSAPIPTGFERGGENVTGT